VHILDSAYRRLYEGVNFRLRTLAGGRYASVCRPVSIAILLTARCNARCIHCDIWKNRGQEDSPDLDEWQALFRELREWLGPVHVVISGGEALLKPYALDLVEYGSSLGLFIELLSHGFWSDQSKFERLALARPGRVTFSFDGVGPTHSLIRGRENFFEKTELSIQTLKRMRKQHRLNFAIRLKTVVMEQNLSDVCQVARFAARNGLDVFYQPIEQNYNTPEDPHWFETEQTWPKDAEQAVRAVTQLKQLKSKGLPIANSFSQLNAMIPYFRDPATWRIATQSHSAHESTQLCSALTTLQVQANGEVTVCSARGAIGNIKEGSIRDIWRNRPRWWEQGCCLEQRLLQNCQVSNGHGPGDQAAATPDT
jgi:MoaA/NifB/PqqE/SkfB family radical SAM enzyme